jgi:hypothetical protein
MTSKPQAAVSEESLIDTFSFVLSFLRDIGLPATESALVEEIGNRFPELRPAAGSSSSPDPDHAASNEASGSGQRAHAQSSREVVAAGSSGSPSPPSPAPRSTVETAGDAVPAEAEAPRTAPASAGRAKTKRHVASPRTSSGSGVAAHDAIPAFLLPPLSCE